MNVLAAILSQRRMLWSIGDQAIVSLGNFLAGIVLARVLGVAEFGRFAMVMMVVSFAHQFVNYFVTLPMMTLAGRMQTRRSIYFQSVFRMDLLVVSAGSVAVATTVWVTFVTRDGSVDPIAVFAAGIALFSVCVQEYVRRSLFAENRPWAGLLSDILRYATYAPFVATVPFVLSGPDHADALLVLALSAALGSVFFLKARLASTRKSTNRFKVFVRRHWRLSRWMLPSIPLGAAQDQLLILFAGILLGDIAAASWRAAQYILGLVNPFVLALENFLPTEAARAFTEGGVRRLRRYLLRRFLIMAAIIYPVLVAIASVPDYWLSSFFGAEYADGGLTLRLYAVAFALILVRAFLGHFFRATEYTKPLFIANIAGACVAVILAYPMATWGGVPGLVCGVIAAQIAACSVMLSSAVTVLNPSNRNFSVGDKEKFGREP